LWEHNKFRGKVGASLCFPKQFLTFLITFNIFDTIFHFVTSETEVQKVQLFAVLNTVIWEQLPLATLTTVTSKISNATVMV